MCVPCKEEEDQQMAIEAAKLYGEVIEDIAGLRAVDKRAPYFYARSLVVQRTVADIMISEKLLTKAQTDLLVKQTQESCYRADKLIAWSQATDADKVAKAPGWTATLFQWAKNDQGFFTSLINEIADWHKYAKDA